MSKNREWLKSLSDKALADEIKYGRELVGIGKHREVAQRELDEAIAEQHERTTARDA